MRGYEVETPQRSYKIVVRAWRLAKLRESIFAARLHVFVGSTPHTMSGRLTVPRVLRGAIGLIMPHDVSF